MKNMEEHNKSESDSLKRGPLAKLHERIQNKYMEMQRKLEKSRSVDSIATLNDEYSYKENRYSTNCDINEKRFSTSSDFGEMNEVFESVTRCEKHDIVIEHMNESMAIEEIYYDETSIFEAKVEISGDDYLSPLPCDNLKTSCESLNELSKEKLDGEALVPPAPPPKMSLRHKIGSRIAAAKNSKESRKNEKVEKLILTNSPKDVVKKKQKTATVTIALIEASELENEPVSEEKTRVVYFRFRLGTEKRKSKAVIQKQKSKAENVSTATFQELFTMNVYDEYLLQISLWEKDILLGKTLIDLLEVKKEKTHKMRINLEDGTSNYEIFMLLTLTGTTLVNTFGDIDEYQELQKDIHAARRKYMWSRFRGDFHDVGQLTIVVYGAKGLPTNESYCVVQLGNESLHTHTVSKTVAPRWNKILTFNVTDVTSVLEVTVMDEKKCEIVGKISILLLKISNGEKKWYALKDSTLRERMKGNNPRILLEMNLYWSLIKASVRVINPKEIIYIETEPKFHRQLFARNLTRAKAVLNWVFEASKTLKTCFEWESRKWNTIALAVWLSFCWFFKAWMIPLLLLSPFFWYRRPEHFLVNWKKYILETKGDEADQDKEDEKKSLRQKFNSLQDMIQTVQNAIGKFASLGESIKNLFNFTVPFLSFLAIFFTLVITTLLYFVPVKYIFMAWGIHKYLRKILKPNRIPNNEILDLLSRVPDDETLIDCQELEHQHVSFPTENEIFYND